MTEDITAPLAGKVIKVNIAPGASVAEDDEILVIEAMKMETLVYAPCAGVVTAVKVKKGDEVQEDQVLASIKTA
jgi:acetyl-CoA carboxylase biotin carboxyl carrier protein